MSATLTEQAPPVAASPVLDLEARLALTDVVMVGRLAEASLTHTVNAARPETTVDLADVVAAPVEAEATPVAALLLRARARIVTGWCRDAARTAGGAMCLAEAVRVEARSHYEQGEARRLLRRALGGGDSIPEQNRRLPNATAAAAVLATAAAMAAERGL